MAFSSATGFLAVLLYAVNIAADESSQPLITMTRTHVVNLTCKIPPSLLSEKLYQLGLHYTTQTGFVRTMVNVSREEHFKNLSLGDIPALSSVAGRLLESDASNSFLTLTFPLSEDFYGRYSCVTLYKVPGDEETKTEKRSLSIGGPWMTKEKISSDGFSADFTAANRVTVTWFLSNLEPHTAVHGSLSLSRNLSNRDSELCKITFPSIGDINLGSSKHSDVLACNLSHVFSQRKHVFRLDLIIKADTRCSSLEYRRTIKTEQGSIIFEAQLNLNSGRSTTKTTINPERVNVNLGLTSIKTTINPERVNENSGSSSVSPESSNNQRLPSCQDHSNTEQRVIFAVLGLVVGVFVTACYFRTERFCKKKHAQKRQTRSQTNESPREARPLIADRNSKKELIAVDLPDADFVQKGDIELREITIRSGDDGNNRESVTPICHPEPVDRDNEVVGDPRRSGDHARPETRWHCVSQDGGGDKDSLRRTAEQARLSGSTVQGGLRVSAGGDSVSVPLVEIRDTQEADANLR